jgi:hypothetical protein
VLTKAFGWAIAAVLAVSLVWWWFDPVGFARNPVFNWFRQLSVPMPGAFR